MGRFFNNKWRNHSVENLEFFCHSDFLWNWFWTIFRVAKMSVSILRISAIFQCWNFTKIKIQSSWSYQNAVFATQNLISRKIGVAENFWNFHTMGMLIMKDILNISNSYLYYGKVEKWRHHFILVSLRGGALGDVLRGGQ